MKNRNVIERLRTFKYPAEIIIVNNAEFGLTIVQPTPERHTYKLYNWLKKFKVKPYEQ